MPSRDDAIALLHEHTLSDRLRRHGLAVEAVMRQAAQRVGGDPESWGITGLLHDFDYEAHPTEHPFWGRTVLEAAGYPAEVVRAIQGHAIFTGVPRDTDMARWLFACDELTGFVMAVALVRPDHSVASVTPRSVRKKLKDRSFARSVSRTDIEAGLAELAVEADVLTQFVIDALTPVETTIGLGTSWVSPHEALPAAT